MDERTSLLLITFVIILVILFLIRFRSSAGVEVSILDWLRLRLWGSNVEAGEQPPETPPSSSITMVGGDLVGRDKVTIVQDPDSRTLPQSRAALRLVLLDRQGGETNDLAVELRSSGFPHDAIFRFALVNDQAGSATKGLVARLDIYWRGSLPNKAIKVAPYSTPQGWTLASSHLTQDHPIVFTLRSPDIMAVHNHPFEWSRIRLIIPERIEGNFLLKYSLSTFDPPIPFQGDLRVHLHYL